MPSLAKESGRVWVKPCSMIEGLQQMDTAELQTLGRLAGLDQKALDGEHDQLVGRLLAWMGEVVGCRGRQPEEIERSVITWFAERFDIETEGASVDRLEGQIRRVIAEESSEELLPFWEVGCAMAFIGPQEAVAPKLELMETAASRLVPSQSARSRMKELWTSRYQEQQDPEQLLADLADDIARLKKQPDLLEPTLVLGLVVALADGRFGVEEEQFYERLASELGLSHIQHEAIKKRVNGIYWESLREVGPKRRSDQKESQTEAKLRALMAAHKTLETSGITESLKEEVSSGFLAQLHRTIKEDPAFRKGMNSWNRTPLMWPIGFAAGMSLYFRHRLRADDHPNLIRIAYLAICRQHLTASPAGAELDTSSIGGAEEHDFEVGKALREAALSPDDKKTVRPIKLN